MRKAYWLAFIVCLLSSFLPAQTPEELFEKGRAALLGGTGPGHNSIEARKYLQQSAEMGYTPAQIMLGSMYDLGIGVPVKPAARRWAFRVALVLSRQGDDQDAPGAAPGPVRKGPKCPEMPAFSAFEPRRSGAQDLSPKSGGKTASSGKVSYRAQRGSVVS